MSLDIWTQPSGYSFGTYSERSTVNIPLPVSASEEQLIRFNVITGKLPRGLRLEGRNIIGTPFEVPRETEFSFVIRAEHMNEISDRTFSMTITGEDEPQWLTNEGLLPVGSNQAFYIIDSSFVDFNLNAIDNDTAAGQTLTYFIASDEGELPPGLVLQPNGRITGFIQPLLQTPKYGDNGNYDAGLYDAVAYDFGVRPANGYDSFVYDNFNYDFFINTLYPRKLNRNYEFIATVTDGDTVTKRKFRIYVVGDDFFRADNVIMEAGEGVYTADVTYVRAPVFTTPKYLGLRRADNYQTFKIDVFEGFYNELGVVFYELATANAIVNGLTQKELRTDNTQGSTFIRFIKANGVPKVGYKINFNQDFTGATNKTYTVTSVEVLGGDFYRVEIDQPLDTNIPNDISIYLGTESRLPPGMQFDTTTGEVFGVVPVQPAVTETYTFTVKARRIGEFTQDELGGTRFESDTSRRMFTVDILGEVESTIRWNTGNNLGVIDVGFPSSLFVNAETTYENSTIFYTLENGQLPPGLDLNLQGEIVGKVNQLRDQNTYKSFWKNDRTYKKKDIVKQNVKSSAKYLTRRKNISTLVTEDNHNFKNNSIVKISTGDLSFNYNSGVKVFNNRLKLYNVRRIDGTGPYRVRFLLGNVVEKKYVSGAIGNTTVFLDSTDGLVEGMVLEGFGFTRRQRIKKVNDDGVSLVLSSRADPLTTPSGTIYFSLPQDLEPLAPQFTKIKGNSGVLEEFETAEPVPVKSTSGSGIGATFLIKKATGVVSSTINTFRYSSLILDSNIKKDIIVVDRGTGYLPGDTITISGSDLGGTDGVNDLTFTLATAFDLRFKVNGNSNPNYNGEFLAVNSTDTSITLVYENNPGTFGTGLISQTTGPGTYDAQTQLTPLNYFNYENVGPNKSMFSSIGELVGEPRYYRAKADQISAGVEPTNIVLWEPYNFPVEDKTPTTIDRNNTFLDFDETTIDRTYTFTVKARDVLGYSAIESEFVLGINIPNSTFYSNIRAQPFLKSIQRNAFKDFINNSNVFDPKLIYRLGDSNFGVQRNLSSLIYAGIETRQAVEYVSAMGYNNKPKRFILGGVKKAVAKEPGTNNVVYEVVYLDLIDPLEKNGKFLPYRIETSQSNVKVTIDNTNEFYNGPFNTDNPFWKRPIPFAATIDRGDILAGDPGTGVKFPSSISIWRKRLREIETARRERNYLPLWMRSIQPGSFVELDFVPAVVLCYCKPGMADEMLLNIKNSGFDFKLLDYTIDRYIIDAVDGYYEDKYLVFRNDRTTIA